ncbi:hypothetical protein [Ekhidna sp.]
MKELLENVVRVLNQIPNTPTRFGTTYELASQIDKELKDNSITVIAVFGDNLVRSIGDGEKLRNLSETGGYLIEKTFATEAEKAAYFQALEDHEGWFGSYILDKEESKKYSHLIGS